MIRADADIIETRRLQNRSSTVIVDARTSMELMKARIPGSVSDSGKKG